MFVVFLDRYAGRPPGLSPRNDDTFATGQRTRTHVGYFTQILARACLIHMAGGSWDKIPFKQNTGEQLKHNNEYLTGFPFLQDMPPAVPPLAMLRHTLFYREFIWMGVSFGYGNTYSWRPGHFKPPSTGPQYDNNSEPRPTGPG